jgi:hypothetical protein
MSEPTHRFADEPRGCGGRAIVLGVGCLAFVATLAHTILSEMSVLEFVRLAWRLAWTTPAVELEIVIALMVGLTVVTVWMEARSFRRLIDKMRQRRNAESQEP